MSMFSTHYLIKSPRWGYWIGGPPQEAASWSTDFNYKQHPIRIFSKQDAERLCAWLFKDIETTIEEDE